ncbi:Predicted dehydrogenase [Alteromonadaceae bacterium Bs31]|nr:Predicted dehydrogenase [Alteromonadaceae bacterium Bs31]
MDRRSFVKNSLVSGLALLSAKSIFAAGISSPKLNIGIIGSGNRGQGLAHILRDFEPIHVGALADTLPFRLEEARAIAPGASPYKDYRKLLDDKSIDAVVIATPMSTHEQIAIDALDAGKHVYCEKTLVKGLHGIQHILDKEAAAPQLVFQSGHQYRSSPLYNEVRSMVQSGYLGDITAIHCQWNRNNSWRKPVPDPSLERQINWRLYREFSGGLVSELMSHHMDFVNWVSDSTPSRICALGGIDHWKDGRENADNVHALFEYPSGMDASFTCTTTNGYEDFQIKILGSNATIVMQRSDAKIFIEQQSRGKKIIVDGVTGATATAWQRGEGATIEAPGQNPTKDALAEFYDAIVHGTAVKSNVYEAANTAKSVQLTLNALDKQKVVYWKDYPELAYAPVDQQKNALKDKKMIARSI